MFGKGAKRKLDEDEEGLEGKALAHGVKVAASDGLSKVSYTLQRQTIFNISLMKLYNHRPLSEPSLERRVLINNMLRRIQEELKQEGSLRPLLLPPSPPPDDPMDEGFCEAPPSFGVLSMVPATPLSQQPSVLSPVAPSSLHPLSTPICQSVQSGPTTLESCLTPASLLEEDGDASFCTSPPPTPPLSPPPLPPGPFLSQVSSRAPVTTIPRDPFSLSLNDMEDLCPPATIPRKVAAANSITTTTSPPLALTQPSQLTPLPSNLYPTTMAHPKDCTRTAGAKEEGPISLADSRGSEARLVMDSLPPPPSSGLVDTNSSPSSSPSASSGFLSDLALDDILFADIDTSMYDFDPCTTSATPTAVGGGLSKLSPVVTADDLLKSLASPYNGPAPQVTSNQPFKIDLTELDHIMEVLVGS